MSNATRTAKKLWNFSYGQAWREAVDLRPWNHGDAPRLKLFSCLGFSAMDRSNPAEIEITSTKHSIIRNQITASSV
jgi:hypothetical protein